MYIASVNRGRSLSTLRTAFENPQTRSNHRARKITTARVTAASSAANKIFTNTASSAPAQQPAFLLLLLRQCIGWYSRKLDTHPYLIKGVTSGLIAASGDILCQSISSSFSKTSEGTNEADIVPERHNIDDNTSISSSKTESATWDVFRTLRFGLLGTLYVAPGCHVWYGALARWYPITTVTKNLPVAKRVVADQFLFTPLFLMGWLSLLWTLEFNMIAPTAHAPSNRNDSTTPSFDFFNDKLVHTDFLQILTANWMLWIPVQALNFYYIPTKYQVLISNCVALVWNTYLSYMTSSSKTKEQTTS